MSRAIPVVKLDADALETMARKHVDRLMDELGHRCDMRAVVVVEFWAMMAGALPFGWSLRIDPRVLSLPGLWELVEPGGSCWGQFRRDNLDCIESGAVWAAWTAEYTDRPRLEE